MKDINEKLHILFVFLADKRLGKSEEEKEITELWNLTQTLKNVEVLDLIVQRGEEFSSTYIGPGKAEEIAEYLKAHDVDIILCNGQLKTTQKFNLTKMYWGINPKIKVWDRVDLILAIFSQHAHTKEAQLQMELARMRHVGPSIFGMGMILSRQGGGVGTRGIGETNTELMKRHWKREIKRVSDQLVKLTDQRKTQIDHRKNLGLKTISLVGYTNAGKTSLFNVLTHKKKLVEDALFATLDSAVGEIYIPELGGKTLISDTIGFIQNLPPELIEAFKSTLLESIHADCILHVIDASDPDMLEKMDVVMEILEQLKIPKEKVILVYNKMDLADSLDKQKITALSDPYPHTFISTKSDTAVETLLQVILPFFPSH